MTSSFDSISFSDMDLLRVVIESERRPNLLVVCDRDDADDVIRQLRRLCPPPFTAAVCRAH